LLSLVHVLEWRAAVTPGVIALSDQQGAELTYAGLAAAVERSAAGFAAAGVSPGDVGTIGTDGYLTIVDRLSDLVITGGENVYPAPFWADRDRQVS
jgi:acyl-CoA synthetase (AMP-forming)/AMP-acid ligase II